MIHQLAKRNTVVLVLVSVSFIPFTTSGYISATGFVFVQDDYYSSAASPGFSFFDEQQCRRTCAVSETCQSYVAFTNTEPLLATCYHYSNKVCVTDSILLKLVPTAVTSTLYSKIRDGSLTSSCNSSQSGTTVNQEPTTVLLESPTTPSAITNISLLNVTTATLTTLTLNTTVANSSINSSVLVEPRPRNCFEYLLNGTIDNSWTLRSVWLTGTSDGIQVDVYCKTGYTLILSNYAKISPIYTFRNDITVFGSTTQRLSTTNSASWFAYTSGINFPALSSLIADSAHILYYESVGDLKDEAAIYSGLNIAADGTLTITGGFQILKGSPSNAFTLPVTGYPFIPSPCGSFWISLTDVSSNCDLGASNMLTLKEYQRVGVSTRRFVALAFK